MTRLQDIESRIVWQEQQIQDLSLMVNRQWAEIDRLKARLEQTRNRLEQLDNNGEDPDQKPPHY